MNSSKTVVNSPIFIPSLNGSYTLLNKNTYLVERDLQVDNIYKQIDLTGNGWIFFYAKAFNGSKISIMQNNKTQLLGTEIIGFVPQMSVIEWLLTSGNLQFSMLISSEDLRISCPTEPVCMSFETKKTEPRDLHDLFKLFLNQLETKTTINISRCTNPCKNSLQIQKWIHKNWNSSFKINDLAKELKISPTLVSRYFKKSFGLTPLKYTNKLRVLTSVNDLLNNQVPISQISYKLGFNDTRLFNEHFRSTFNTTPFSFKKRNSLPLQ